MAFFLVPGSKTNPNFWHVPTESIPCMANRRGIINGNNLVSVCGAIDLEIANAAVQQRIEMNPMNRKFVNIKV